MKKLLLTLVISLAASQVMAGRIVREVSKETTNIDIELNKDTVICSMLGYGMSRLKILIPNLADLTVLDHRNQGAEAPCVSAGVCKSSLVPPGFKGVADPGDILDPTRPIENVNITVTRSLEMDLRKATQSEKLRMNTDHVCDVYLAEKVDVPVRGVDFTHLVSDHIGVRHVDDCIQ